ncbi:hypothetical protein Plhal703r1_c01g0005451 [Plasmopara halstedii]
MSVKSLDKQILHHEFESSDKADTLYRSGSLTLSVCGLQSLPLCWLLDACIRQSHSGKGSYVISHYHAALNWSNG